ncbi:MAG: segregation and condensation protein B [Nitrososphaerota archaeon]
MGGDLEAELEALLYATSVPLGLDELAAHLGTSRKRAERALKAVAQRLNATLRALRVAEYPGRKYILELRPEFGRLAAKVSGRRLLPRAVLNTLAYVAYYQPISASELALKRGSRVYSHLKVLEALGFIAFRREGRRRLCFTTPLFARYWGLSEDPERMKKELAKVSL